MLHIMKTGTGLAFGLFLLTATPSARADDDDCRSGAEGDLESLRARLHWTGSDWNLAIRFEVELEDVHPREVFELILTPLHCGREMADPSGEAVRWVVPLDYRASCDDDEVELEDEVNMRLPPELVDDPFRLRVCGEIICRESGKVLDDTTTCVKVCSLPPPPVVEHVEIREEPIAVYPPPPPQVIYAPPPPPVVIYRRPPPVVVYRPYYHCQPFVDCRAYWRDGFVHVGVGW